ncbi:hypothetical protein R69746_08175 [Paraburkholderia aspalathi]|uniref:hypothetical protein n=1 Tax=Paraburkholderia aspalathi TaxID=1324617 RepID=UPI00190B1E59|nr:hypothetical protein [Paraburkholderia aspalathi]MBK3844115.1 hypothetical protein [Paraburkholderia aspalathi]CAE6861189.1 hypothetical protein R75465_07672 [Paraburkholderia aspalathi]CAE6867281.1 hypothetical protein R69746_08175 [Paraburkholderia aspalathi]
MSEVQKAIAAVTGLETRLQGALAGAGQRAGEGMLSRTHCDAARTQVMAARHLLYANVYFALERRIAQVELRLEARSHPHLHPEGD